MEGLPGREWEGYYIADCDPEDVLKWVESNVVWSNRDRTARSDALAGVSSEAVSRLAKLP